LVVDAFWALWMPGLLAAIYSFHYMSNAQKALRTAAHYLFFSLLVASMALVVTAANMITFMLAWEIMSLSSFFLVVYNYEAEKTARPVTSILSFPRWAPCSYWRLSGSFMP
jgi:hydrogenase-4 component B